MTNENECRWVYIGSCTHSAFCGYDHVQEVGELPASCPSCNGRVNTRPIALPVAFEDTEDYMPPPDNEDFDL